MRGDTIEGRAINTIRTLSMDAVQAANSGHPGTPMALAPVVYSLWQRHLRFDPEDCIWPNRDRFVLSAAWRRCAGRASTWTRPRRSSRRRSATFSVRPGTT